MNTILLIILILACTYMELSQKVDTNNIIEKLGMGSIVLGSGLELANVHTHLIILGSALYFSVIAYRGCMTKQNRRKADRA